MILQEYLEVKPLGKIRQYYEELGYKLNGKEPIWVKNQDLSNGSQVIEKRQCDNEECYKVFSRSHRNMIINFEKYGIDLCPECAEKERLKRIKETSLRRYGVSNPMKSKQIQDKAKQTTLEHYGVEYPTQNKSVIELRTANFIEKYGVENPQQVNEIKEKTGQTNLIKYGSKNTFGSKVIQEKIKETNLEKYGVEYINQSKEIREKTEKTCLEKYGTKTPLQNEEIRKKIRKTLEKNGTVPTSKQQIQLFDICVDMFSSQNVKLNFPLSTLSLDVLLNYKGYNIDIEYDGWYWHKNKIKQDYARDSIVKRFGYKILRVKSAELLPTKEQLIEALNFLTEENSNNTYTHIILEDWGK